MKAMFGACLLVFSVAAFAGGQNYLKGAPDNTWQGDSNDDEHARSIAVNCPVNTTAGSVEAIPDESDESDESGLAITMIVKCYYNY